jgi:hypothetical protein
MATNEQVAQAILDRIAETAPQSGPEALEHLAVAYAWVTRPDQPH